MFIYSTIVSGDVTSCSLDTPLRLDSVPSVWWKMASDPGELNLLNNVYQALSRKWAGVKEEGICLTELFTSFMSCK